MRICEIRVLHNNAVDIIFNYIFLFGNNNSLRETGVSKRAKTKWHETENVS